MRQGPAAFACPHMRPIMSHPAGELAVIGQADRRSWLKAESIADGLDRYPATDPATSLVGDGRSRS